MTEISRDAARQALWRIGRLPWKNNDAQKRIEEQYEKKKGMLFVLNCARRTGKTHWEVKKDLEYALDPTIDRPRIKVAAAFLNDLQEFIIPEFMQILRDCPPDRLPQWSATHKKFQFPHNGAEIKLIGLDKNPNGMRGNYADVVDFQEAGLITRLDYLYSSVAVPMTAYRTKPLIMMGFTPPETPDHPVVQFSEKAKQEDAYIELDIDQNKMLSAKDKAMLLSECLTETERLREYYCKFIIEASRAIIPEWEEKYCVDTPYDEFRIFYHNYIAMDLGVKNDFTAGLLFYYDFLRSKVVIEDEFQMRGPEMTTDKLAALINQKTGERWHGAPVYRRVADNDNPLLIQDLGASYKIPFIGTDKSALESMVNKVRIFMKQGRIEVNPRCKNLLGCLRTGLWDIHRKKFDHSAVFGHFDWLSALIYGVRNVDVSTNPIPVTHGFNVLSPNTLIIPSKKPKIFKQFGD